MKVLYIEAQRKQFLEIPKQELDKLPDKIFLAYSVQYKRLAFDLKKKLGNRVQGMQQVLGCSELKSKYPILLVGSGRFHALQLALQGNTIYIVQGNTISKLGESDIVKFKIKRKTALVKFLSANKVGILVSCKIGQENLKKAQEIRKKLERKGKSVFLFMADSINLSELENYDIESWVNTACPGLGLDDSKIVNINELK